MHAGIKEMCSTGISFGRSKSCSNLALKPELEPTVTDCLAGKDVQDALYTGAVQKPSGDSCQTSVMPISPFIIRVSGW